MPYYMVGPPVLGPWGASTNDVFALPALGRVVRTLGSTADTLSLGMVRIS
jgi:hypothetical protein